MLHLRKKQVEINKPKKKKKSSGSALLFHAFGKMQPGCNGENLQSGSSSFYSSKKKHP
jgi:hypothetical protein